MEEKNPKGAKLQNLNKEPEKSRKSKLPLVIGIVVAVLVVCYIAGAIYFQSHFFIGSTVNGIDASGKTPAKVMVEIREKANSYSLTITDDDGNKSIISTESIGYVVDDNTEKIEKILSTQNGWLWGIAVFSPTEYESDVVISFDSSLLKSEINKLPSVQAKNPTKSEDATYAYDGEEFSIVSEVYGTEVDVAALLTNAEEAIYTMNPVLDLRESGSYVMPEVLSSDEALLDLIDTLNDGINYTITYALDDGTEEVLTPEKILEWLTIEDGKMVYDEELVRAFVQEMAEKYNTKGKPMTITSSTNGEEVTVPGGRYGYEIDEDAEVEQLLSELEAGEDVTRDFIYSQTAQGGRSGPGNLYFEVNKTAQMVYVVQNGEVVLESACITGIPMNGHDTHVGCWDLTEVASPRVLNGVNDDGSEYHTKVSYWMHFYNGEGFHDATWQSNWGGYTYLVRGSHGCVNLPLSVAQEMYSYASVGVPVYVYTLAGTETGDATTYAVNQMVLSIKQNLATLMAPTLESDAIIRQLWAQWCSLTPEAQARVSNYAVLISAHDTMNLLRAQAGLPTD